MADKDATIVIKVADNKMKVTANYFPNNDTGNPLSVEDVLSKLNSMNIKTGIKHDHIKTICSSDKAMRNIFIAECIPPKVGEKAHIEFYIEINKLRKARVKEDGGVDFRDLGEISSATEGEELYRRIPPTIGEPGKDVYGNEIPGIMGKDIKIIHGPGTAIDENDKNLVRATQSGEIVFKGGIVQILTVHKIKGDVDYSTGNVKFNGSLMIHGNVKAGFKVMGGGDITVAGNVEDAEVIGENDIIIMGGYTGEGNGIVRAGRDVFVKFVENQKIEADRDIIISGQAYHSNLKAGRSIEATGPKSLIVGGKCEAKTSVKSSKFGSDAAVKTVIKIGIDPKLAEKIKNAENEIKQTEKLKEKIEKSVIYLYRQKIDNKGQLPPEKSLQLKKLEKIKEAIPDKLVNLQKKIDGFIEEKKGVDKAFATAEIAVYPKVQVIIGNQRFLNEDTLGPSTVKMFEGEVVRFSK